MRWPFNRRSELYAMPPISRDDSTLKLEAAKEILSEIFGIKNPEVEEMIRIRLEMRPLYDQAFYDKSLYDQEFHLDGFH
jgi:hypothetical protein